MEIANVWIYYYYSDLTISLITTLEECDIPKMPSMAKTEMKKIGFAISA